MNFKVYGPYLLPRNERFVTNEKKKRQEFLNSLDEDVAGLSQACGCYVFLVGKKAWYVGMTGKNTFEKECFGAHKLNLYNRALQIKKSVPRLILIPGQTRKGKFTKPGKNGNKNIEMLERLLIGAALQHNKKLLNIRDAARLRKIRVPGFINTGQGGANAKAVRVFKTAIGL